MSDSKNETQKKGLTREELKSLITEMAVEVATAAVDEAIKPLKEQHTNWMAQIQTSDKSGSREAVKSNGIGAARYVRAVAAAGGDMARAEHFAKKAWNDDLGARVVKTLQAGDFTGAGFLIPDEFAAEIIELLRNKTVVRAAGARVVDMPNGQMTIRRQDGAATATYVGEATNIPVTEPTGGQIVMTAKKLAAVVPISNDLLKYTSGPSADEFVRDDLVQVLAIREDQAFLRDDGLASKPKGLRYWAAAANLLNTNGSSSSQIETDFKDLANALDSANVRMVNPAWFMSPRSVNHLRIQRDAAGGNLLFPEMRNSNPTIYGWPVFATNSIPNNLGGGTNTEVYLVDMADALIGQTSGLEIAVDPGAAYVDSNSVTQSAFTRDETVMRAIMRHDFIVRHDESVAVITDVAWGS